VLGSLIEKEFTTPSTIRCRCTRWRHAARNLIVIRSCIWQSEIMQALDSLRDKHLAWQTTARAHGFRNTGMMHDCFFSRAQELAVIGELLLRGPQTVGELRTHAARFCEFAICSRSSRPADIGGAGSRAAGRQAAP